MNRNWLNGKSLLGLILVALYFIGLILIILGMLTWGVTLWAGSTIAGFIVLMLMQRANEKTEAKKEPVPEEAPEGEEQSE